MSNEFEIYTNWCKEQGFHPGDALALHYYIKVVRAKPEPTVSEPSVPEPEAQPQPVAKKRGRPRKSEWTIR